MALTDNELKIIYADALALVYDAIALANKGLLANPSKEQERKLNKTLLRLEAERTDLMGTLIALAKKQPVGVPPPTQAQVDEIANLTGEVEGLTRANITAAGALAVASGVLDLATAIMGFGPHGPGNGPEI